MLDLSFLNLLGPECEWFPRNCMTSASRGQVPVHSKDQLLARLEEYLAARGDRKEKLFPVWMPGFKKVWKEAAERSGVYLTPKALRFWFANEMARLGVPDRFIDAFQGRIPRSVLARHYTDHSLENLKAIYDKAGLKVLS